MKKWLILISALGGFLSCTNNPETFQLAKELLKPKPVVEEEPPPPANEPPPSEDPNAALLIKKRRSIWLVGGSKATGTAANPPAYAVAVGAFARELDYYDPVTNTWGTVYPSTHTGCGTAGVDCYSGNFIPVLGACYAGYQGKIYVAGGLQENNTFANAAPTNRLQIYDIAQNRWLDANETPNMPAGVAAAACEQRGTKLYVFSGTDQNLNHSGNPIGSTAGQTILQIYDFVENAWSSQASAATGGIPPATAAYEACIVSEGHIMYRINGKINLTGYSAAANHGIFNFFLANYAVNAPPAHANYRAVGSSCLYLPATSNVPARIVMVGGIGNTAGTPALTGTNRYLTPLSNTTAATAIIMNAVFVYYAPFNVAPNAGLTNLPLARSHGALVVKNNILYYFGGNSIFAISSANPNPTPTKTVYAADVEIPVWLAKIPFTNTNIPLMPTARWGHGAVNVE